MVRKLKHHEQKLLRKVDFITYKSDHSHRAATICRRYSIQRPEDYTKYAQLARTLQKLSNLLSLLPATNPTRLRITTLLLQKLHTIGLLPTPTTPLSTVATLSASRFCRRRLAVVMTRLLMAPTVQAANKFIEQGHVRVGTEIVTDPAMLITRGMEDWVGWGEGGVKKIVDGWRGGRDDFDAVV